MLLIALAAVAHAETPPDDLRWTVTVDPLTTAVGIVHVQVERTLGSRASVYAGPSLRLFDGILTDTNGPYTALGGEVGVRGFVVGTAPRGVWVMARGVLARMATSTPTREAGLGGYTSGLVGGTAVLGPGLVLSGGVGVSWFDYGVSDYGVHGVAPAAHSNLGWAF